MARASHLSVVGPWGVTRALTSLVLSLAASLASHAAEIGPTSADYAAALTVLKGGGPGLVSNESVEPHWMGDSGRFWYRRDGNEGPEFVVVTSKGVKSPAFDHAAVARALSTLGGPTVGDHGLPASLKYATLTDDLTHLTGQIGDKSFDCDLSQMQCRTSDFRAAELASVGLISPNGQSLALAHDDNLFVRDVRTGNERALTTDGAPFYSWAKQPDDSPTTIARQKSGQKSHLGL